MLLFQSFLYKTETIWICLVFFFLMLLVIRVGYFLGSRSDKSSASDKLGTLENAIYALLGLLLAFTFSMGNTRFESRVSVVIQEANAIGTAILRSDLYADSIRAAFRKDFRLYVEAREEYYKISESEKHSDLALQRTEELQKRIWKRAVALSSDPQYQVASMQMIPALNDMIDIVTTRQIKNESRIPDIIFYLLFFMSLSTGFFTGYINGRASKKDWTTVIGFSLMITLVIFVILDIDRPRRGFITTSIPNKYITNLKNNLK